MNCLCIFGYTKDACIIIRRNYTLIVFKAPEIEGFNSRHYFDRHRVVNERIEVILSPRDKTIRGKYSTCSLQEYIPFFYGAYVDTFAPTEVTNLFYNLITNGFSYFFVLKLIVGQFF